MCRRWAYTWAGKVRWKGRRAEAAGQQKQVRAAGLEADVSHPNGIELTSPKGEQRGFVEPKLRDGRPVLEDLWVMQGSLCDLKCKHCYTASSPSNDTLQQIRFNELRPHLDDARAFGVQKIYFTGGEVFVNEDVLRSRAATNEDFRDDDVVTVLLPEFVPAHWWQRLLHNQSGLILRGALMFKPKVVVTSVRRHLRK